MKVKKQPIGRPPVKDKKISVTFTALSSKVQAANKKGLRNRNEFLQAALDEFIKL
jgi:hypothetical protein